MLKLPCCSLETPCQACLQSAAECKGAERNALSFRYCVRARFADVNIFESPEDEAADAMQTETLMRMLGDLLARIATPAEFTLADDPAAFNKAMLSWLTDPDFRLPNGSVVGLCCSSLLGLQFREDADAGAAAGGSTDDLMLDFRRFLLATSLAHAGWRDGSLKAIRANDLCAAGRISGARLFRRLGRVLTPQFLSRCGRDQCQALFLLVLGAVLGVGYYYSSSQLEDDRSPDVFPPAVGRLSPELRRSPTLWLAMKEQLCRMLAHHLIFLGSMLEIKLEAGVEQRIIETAVARWNKAEDFVWAEMPSSEFGVGEDRKEERREEEEEEEEERPPSTRTCKSPEVVRTEDVDEDSVLVQPSSSRVPSSHCAPASSSSAPPPPPAAARLPPLVTISLSELKQFHPESVDAWSENPQSYLSMFDDELGSTGERAASSASGAAPELTARQEAPEKVQPGMRKRRSMWIVRSFDAGPEQGLVNVHARLQPGTALESIRAFV